MTARDDYPELHRITSGLGVEILEDAETQAEAALNEIDRLRRQVEFMEAFSDGGGLALNGIPWREAFDRLNAIVSDPVPSPEPSL